MLRVLVHPYIEGLIIESLYAHLVDHIFFLHRIFTSIAQAVGTGEHEAPAARGRQRVPPDNTVPGIPVLYC